MSLLGYSIFLTLCTLLLYLRVIGQIVVVLRAPRWLPPMEQWQSGLLPYPVLLLGQVIVLTLMTWICVDFARGAGRLVEPRWPNAGVIVHVDWPRVFRRDDRPLRDLDVADARISDGSAAPSPSSFIRSSRRFSLRSGFTTRPVRDESGGKARIARDIAKAACRHRSCGRRNTGPGCPR